MDDHSVLGNAVLPACLDEAAGYLLQAGVWVCLGMLLLLLLPHRAGHVWQHIGGVSGA